MTITLFDLYPDRPGLPPESLKALFVIGDVFSRLPDDPQQWLNLLAVINLNVVAQVPCDRATRDALPQILADQLRHDLAALDGYGEGHA